MSAATRREAIAAIAATSIAAPAFALPTAKDSGAWDQAMAYFRHCEAAVNAYAHRHDEAEERYRAAVKVLPHEAVEYQGGLVVTTADQWAIDNARRSVKGVVYLEPCAFEHHKNSMALLDAVEARNAKIAEIDQRVGWTVTSERYEALVDRMVEAQNALLAMPAPHSEALLWKLEYFMADSIYTDELVAPTVADMRRMLGRAA